MRWEISGRGKRGGARVIYYAAKSKRANPVAGYLREEREGKFIGGRIAELEKHRRRMEMSSKSKSLIFGRETRVKVPKSESSDNKTVFAVCIKTDDVKLLVPTKIYKIKLGGNRACVIDEEGEVAIYPMDFFLVLSLSPTAENTLAEVWG